MMKKCFCLILALVMCLMASSAMAAASNIKVTNATYYDNNALKSVDCIFDWGYGMASVEKQRLVLMTELLSDDDLTNLGNYGNDFDSFDEVLTHDQANHTFGIISYSNEQGVSQGSEANKRVFNFKNTDIPLDVDKTYYVYLWTQWGDWTEYYYPDNLFSAIRVEDGKVSYSSSDDGREFDENKFTAIDDTTPPSNPNPNPDPQPNNPPQNDPQPEETKPTYTAPKTGDAADLALWLALMAVSAVCVAGLFRKTRKEV